MPRPWTASSISGRPRDDIHDHDRGGKDLSPSRRSELAQWGQMTMAEGKHKGKTFAEVIESDRDYSSWMKKHPKLSSGWATSFQSYVKAWDMTQLKGQNPRMR